MKHLTEEELILHYYRESDVPDGARDHLDSCAACRESFLAVEADLKRIPVPAVPLRGADYGAQVWERLAPRLAQPSPRSRWSSKTTWTLAIAASLVLAFLAGRLWERDPFLEMPQGIDAASRQRVLAAAAIDHLEKAEILLLDISQSSPDGADIERVRSAARSLVIDNRLLRLSSQKSGDWRLTTVLDELERRLLDLAHLSEADGKTDWVAFQNRLGEDDLTFKVRAVSFQLRERELERARRLAREGT